MENRNQFILQLKDDTSKTRIITQRGQFPNLERNSISASDFNESELDLLESFINMIEEKISKE